MVVEVIFSDYNDKVKKLSIHGNESKPFLPNQFFCVGICISEVFVLC